MKNLLLVILFLFDNSIYCFGQFYTNENVVDYFKQNYERVPVTSIAIKHNELFNELKKLTLDKNIFLIEEIGKSYEGRSINLIKIGNGNIRILLWSQMHGDEPTATLAILDILRFIEKNKNDEVVKFLLKKLEILIIPMLNPDGADRFTRRNAQDIDINRDALRLQTPEGRILKGIRDKYNPLFAFNLHDQEPYYSNSTCDSLIGLALLAPAYDEQKSTNDVRKRAKQIVAFIYNSLQKYLPGKIAEYDDEFEKRAFGDNMQLWGSSTILIESGGFRNDPGKEYLRKMNYIALLSSFVAIADNSYTNISVEEYDKIPKNKRKFCDLLIKNGEVVSTNGNYIIDIAINYEKDLSNSSAKYHKGKIIDLGDLSNYKGINEIDATGYLIYPGKFTILLSLDSLKSKNFIVDLLLNGVTNLITNYNFSFEEKLPFNVVKVDSSAFEWLKNNVNEKCFYFSNLEKNSFIKDNVFLSHYKIGLGYPANLFLVRGKDKIVIIQGMIKYYNGELLNF